MTTKTHQIVSVDSLDNVHTAKKRDVNSEDAVSVLFLHDPCLKTLLTVTLVVQIVVTVLVMYWNYTSYVSVKNMHEKMLRAYLESADTNVEFASTP